MFNTLESLLIVLLTVSASIGVLRLVQWVWPSESRRQHNDLIGWHLGVLGSTYAVIIGFMLFAVWTNFETASSNAESEANCLVNLVRSSRGLPAGLPSQIQSLSDGYAKLMLTEEWPAMARGEINHTSHPIVRQLWAALTNVEVHSAREQISLDHALTELAHMTEFRRQRQLQVDSYLPDILWLVLILGATVTILSACFFGSWHFRLHVIQVIMLALMISSILVAIGDINRPFQGSVHVDAIGFERARAAIADLR